MPATRTRHEKVSDYLWGAPIRAPLTVGTWS